MGRDAAHDFDFLFGRWHVHNRKLTDVTDPACAEWIEFVATSEVVPVLGGSGNVDRLDVPSSAPTGAFEGLTLRLFDPAGPVWRIWWSSTRAPGVLDPPVVGRFAGGLGVFECQDEIAGRAVVVRFEWRADPNTPRWQQSFSFDAGRTWLENWTMAFTRAG